MRDCRQDCRQKNGLMQKCTIFSRKTAKTTLYLSIKCGNLAESQGFEDRFVDFSALFTVLQIHYPHFLFFLKLCIAYCFGYFHCNCSMIAVKEKY